MSAHRPLPTKDGVGPSCVALPEGAWPTMVDFLAHQFPAVSASTWVQRMLSGDVVDDRGSPIRPDQPFKAHVRIYYYRSIEVEPRIPFEEAVLHQDEHLIVVDKPHFLPVTPGGRYLQETLLVRLKRKLGIDTLVPIHRLDRETAGVVMFSVQASTRGLYQALFAQRAVTKTYHAVAAWRPELGLPITRHSRLEENDCFMQMHEVDGAPNSETRLDVIKVQDDLALYRLSPVTGRKHQLRVHCAALGIPILHDQIYPRLAPVGPDDHAKPLQLLAHSVEFIDPLTGQRRHHCSQQSLLLS